MKNLKAKTGLKSHKPLKATATLKSKDKPTKQVKPSVSKLKKEADRWHSLATRYRFALYKDDEWVVKCFTCPKDTPAKPIKNMQCGHFQSRAHNSTRYDEENTAPQCYGCNVMQQGRQYEFGLQIDLLYGVGTAKKLAELARQPHQFKPQGLIEIINDRKQEVAFYEQQTAV